MSSATTPAASPSSPRPESILPCNFRSAGRVSNDSIRHLRTMHEAFARNFAHSLDLFLGSPLGVKMIGVEQIGARDFSSSLATGSYLVPFTLMPLQSRVIAKFDNALLSPLLDLLLGGSGDALDEIRELTDIDEELIRSVTELIAVQLERTWKSSAVSVIPSPSLKGAAVGQIFAMEERVISLQFEMTLGATRAGMRLILPMAFCNALVRSSLPETARRISAEVASAQRLRERLQECTMTLSAELADACITVGELLSLKEGAVLNLRTPVQVPVRLNVAGYPLYEMTPVRRGGHKTAQLGRPCQPPSGARG